MTTNSNSSIKILVVDDEPELLQITELLLKKENYNVTTATSGQSCLDAIHANKPDLLLLDVMLPDINGSEICKIIKNNPQLSSIYVFLISGLAIQTESISEGLELGADGYLIKPIKNRELLARIEAVVRIIHTEKALRESEEKFRNLFEYMEDGFLQADVDGVITLANNAMAKMFNYNSPNEILGMLTLNLFKNSEERADLMKELKANEKVYNYEVLGKTKQGNDLWILGNFKVICNQKGERIGTEGLFRDITDRKQTEFELLKAKEKAEESEQEMSKTLSNFNKSQSIAKIGSLELDIASGKVWWSNELYRIFGVDPAKYIPSVESNAQFVHHDDNELFHKEVFKAFETGDQIDYEIRIITPSGKLKHCRFLANVIFNENNQAEKLIGTFSDISERKHIEIALRESEVKFRALGEFSPLAIYSSSGVDQKAQYINPAFYKIFGFTMEEVPTVGEWWIKAFPDEKYREWVMTEWQKNIDIANLNKTDVAALECVCNCKDGSKKIISWEGTSIGDQFFAFGLDLTERKKAEEALKQANTELENLHDNLNEAVFAVDMINNKMISVSIAHQTVFGHSPSEFFNNPQLWFEMILPEYKPFVNARLPILTSGNNMCYEYRIFHPNGEIRWIEDKIIPTLDKNGILTRIDGVSYDITNRKQIETKLLESETNFRRSISESPIGIRIVSEDGKTVYANKALLDIYELNSLEEFITTPAINKYTPESYKQHLERKKKRKDGVDVFEYEKNINCKNGDTRHLKVSRKEILWNGSKHFQVINQDITEQRKVEEELRKLSIAVEQSPNAECITDTNGIIEYVNPITIKLTGYTREELIGSKTSIFSSGETPKQKYRELWKTIKSGSVWEGELLNKKKNAELYWESTTISPIFDNQGKITHFLAIKVDITEQKKIRTALLNSEEQLHRFAAHLQNVREEEKIAIAREIHDDLAQISVALKFDLGMFERKLSKGNEAVTFEELLSKLNNFSIQVENSIKSARRIINGLRPELIELLGFEEACKSYLLDFEKAHHIKSQFESTILNLNIDLQKSVALYRILQEAFNNITKHAKATLVTVQLSNPAGKLVMEIVDNGVGFDENNKGRIDSYGMIGMKERVILLEGELFITSKVGKGTIVRVEIPN